MPLCNVSLDDWGDVFAIATGLVAVFWFAHAAYDRCRKRQKLETYLINRWEASKLQSGLGGDGLYRHSIIHLMA